MEIPPLSERPVSQEEEEAFLRSIQPRRGLFGRRFIGPRRWRLGWAWVPRVHGGRSGGEGGPGEGGAAFSGGTSGGGVAAWLRADPMDWGIRIAVVLLIVAGCYAVYINGVAEGWWRAWGENPTAQPTRPAMSGQAPTPGPSVSGEAAMSGGYQIGPDGVLVRPAEHAAATYPLPELPQAANMSDPSSEFANSYLRDIDNVYQGGWAYGNESRVVHVLRLEPVPAGEGNVQPNTIGVKLQIVSSDGVTCRGQKITVKDDEYTSTLSLFMTWKDGRWIETQGRAISEHEQ